MVDHAVTPTDKVYLVEDKKKALYKSKTEKVYLVDRKQKGFSKTKAEKVFVKETITNLHTYLSELDFWGDVVVSRTNQYDFDIGWQTLGQDQQSNFWGDLTVGLTTIPADFWGVVNVSRTQVRIHQGVGFIPTCDNGSIFNPIGISLSGGISGQDYSFTVTTTTNGNAEGSLGKLSIEILNFSQGETGEGIRKYSWGNFRSGSLGTQGQMSFEDLSVEQVTNIFTGSFPTLSPGRYCIYIQAFQSCTGNIYTWTDFISVGEQPYSVSVSGDVSGGSSPLEVNFSTTRHDGGVTEVESLIWDFEPGVKQSFIYNSYGRDRSYSFNRPGLYAPVVTYVMEDGFLLSRGVELLYPEE